jgi:hypothetical protein
LFSGEPYRSFGLMQRLLCPAVGESGYGVVYEITP